MSFNLVVSAGHCGTKWLTHVFNQQSGVQAYHECRMHHERASWWVCGTRGPNATILTYWGAIKTALRRNHAVWDVQSWFPWEVEAVDAIVPVDKTIYLVRNGILQLDSLITTAQWKSQHFSRWAYEVWLPKWHDAWAATTPRALPLEFLSREERLCMLIAGSLAWPTHHPDWDVLRLEDLTTSLGHLNQIVDLPDDELGDLQKLDINRHTKGTRDPVAIWATWSKPLQVAYSDICGPIMDAYNYELPGVPHERGRKGVPCIKV